MIGEGVKQIPSYKCQIPFDELNLLREEFWKEKIKKNRRWRAIKEICESDAATAAQLLEVAGFCCKENLKTILELENPNIIYKVPNYCITDPVFERDYDKFKKKNIDQTNINLFCFIVNDSKELHFNVLNTDTGKSIKELIAKEQNFNFDDFKIRLFFSGQEILDEHPLYYHSLGDNSKIQVNYCSHSAFFVNNNCFIVWKIQFI